jgi:excisionase family DNA binding protein
MTKIRGLDIEDLNLNSLGIEKGKETQIRLIAERIGVQVGQTVTELVSEIIALILIARSPVVSQSSLSALPSDKLLTAKQVASFLNISKAKVYQMMRDGKIATIRMGKTQRVRAQDLEVFVKNNASQAG